MLEMLVWQKLVSFKILLRQVEANKMAKTCKVERVREDNDATDVKFATDVKSEHYLTYSAKASADTRESQLIVSRCKIYNERKKVWNQTGSKIW